MAASPPAERQWRAGGLRLAIQGRELRIEGAPSSWTLATFTGPVDAGSIRALRRERPRLAVVLGAIGEDAADASRTLAALAELRAPVLVLPGGADRLEVLEEAFEALEPPAADLVVPAWALRRVTIGSIELVPVAGAPDGRYAIGDDACGFSADDVASFEPGDAAHRYLLSWAAPRGSGPGSLGVASVEAGSPVLADLAERLGTEGAIFAWPHEAAGSSAPRGVAVRPLAGAWIVRADGSRAAPGATLLTAGPRGLELGRDSP